MNLNLPNMEPNTFTPVNDIKNQLGGGFVIIIKDSLILK